jgi:hypothetical protein
MKVSWFFVSVLITFIVFIVSADRVIRTVNYPCKDAGTGVNVCCEIGDATYNSNYYPRKQSLAALINGNKELSDDNTVCYLVKEYIPSKYEMKHFKKTSDLTLIQDETERTHALLNFVFVDFPDSLKWIERVRLHMANPEEPVTEEDEYYLSKFKQTRSCYPASSVPVSALSSSSPPITDQPPTVTTWYEYIEPLTLHNRDPRSFAVAARTVFRGRWMTQDGTTMHIPRGSDIIQMDHILLHKLDDIVREKYHHHAIYNGTMKHYIADPKMYMFDAGSKEFWSSTMWFVCGYIQVQFVSCSLCHGS